MSNPPIPVGFDYARSVLDLRQVLTYETIAERMGYESKSSVSRILAGVIPEHPQGEALWALYVETFGRKPPHSVEQAAGRFLSNVPLGEQHVTT